MVENSSQLLKGAEEKNVIKFKNSFKFLLKKKPRGTADIRRATGLKNNQCEGGIGSVVI